MSWLIVCLEVEKMVNFDKISNAEMLRKIYAIDIAYQKEHKGASLISNDLRAVIEDCQENTDNDRDFNERFNAQLKAQLPENFDIRQFENQNKKGRK